MRAVALLAALVLAAQAPMAQSQPATPSTKGALRSVAPRGPLSAEERNTIGVFESVSPSVVYITTVQHVRDFFSRNVMRVPQGTGSGFVWDEQGHVVTNYHVIAGASEARVRLNDGRDYPASLVGAWRLGAPAKHCGILSGAGRMIHAYDGHAVLESALPAAWARRAAYAFRFPPAG